MVRPEHKTLQTTISPAWLSDASDFEALWSPAEYRAAALNAQYQGMPTERMLEEVIDFEFDGALSLVSSFGTQSAVLLSLVAKVDPWMPVLFIDTGKLFPETLAYRDQLADRLGLKDVQTVAPRPASLNRQDPHGALWMQDVEACCHVRKVEPLDDALAPFSAWISGRKRFQGADRAVLPTFEADGDKIKVNPLATWSKKKIEAYAKYYDLPDHPLLAEGYRSVGCAPCTQKTPEGADDRAGRWAGMGKTECGIHFARAS
ncbi:MAG: phosphoadenylyl-sulfate reductase [Pseudomonadota bacterium]